VAAWVPGVAASSMVAVTTIAPMWARLIHTSQFTT
jgi:hypothetical protein